MRRSRSTTKYGRRPRDMERMGWIKTQPCALAFGFAVAEEAWPHGLSPDACGGITEAHHAGVHGLGQKAPDDTCIPLCSHHHRCLTDRRGVFSGLPSGAVKTWELAAIAYYQARYSADPSIPF